MTGVLAEDAGAVRILTFDRPEKRNAFTLESMAALQDRLEEGIADPGVRAFVLTGSAGTFCAGVDVAVLQGATVAGTHANLVALHRTVRTLAAGPKPAVAAVEGHAVGAGLSLALACDLVVAAEDATLRCAFPRLGLMADLGLLWSLPQRVGHGMARRMLLLDEPVRGTEAADIGLADYRSAPGEALEIAMDVARRLAAQPPLAVGFTKAVLAAGPRDLDAVLRQEASDQALLHGTSDFHEGLRAFTERRDPVFTGRR
ncbi:enoyl-CoA hydratase/isomerase family protein [Actinomadura chibensis]|uniref:Enoyl-CoA hydratase n=1 Tax=Actinomadura chibensis TaxID=392828 RepID=A0A5D0NMF7_9ACTN|nr:enoyl-CoA hydratase-related protein [Actinomadura chibensis]TYB45458.1 enoyl-CoA hydratase [Actinomadura chibensis]